MTYRIDTLESCLEKPSHYVVAAFRPGWKKFSGEIIRHDKRLDSIRVLHRWVQAASRFFTASIRKFLASPLRTSVPTRTNKPYHR